MSDGLDRPLCTCHDPGVPMHRNGMGGWRCAVQNCANAAAWRKANRARTTAYSKAYNEAHRERRLAYYRGYYRANREKQLAYKRDLYDSDPIFRIGKSLKNTARRRAETLERMRERVLANG